MKTTLQMFAMVVSLTLIGLACGSSAKEIPMEKMARITVKMAMENKIEKDQQPKDIDDAVIEPYAKAEGFSPADFKHTAELIDKDEAKQKEIEEIMGRLMMEEMMKALGGTDMGSMMKGIVDSAAAELAKDTAAR
jgi:hypothetical protein